MLKNKSKILISSLVIFLFPIIARGADLILDCYEKGNCGICDALKLTTKIANYIIGLSGVAALVMFLIAGLTLITSKGNSGKLTSAKKIMIDTVIGMFVIYIAWAGVNYVIYSFTDAKNSKGVATVFSKSWQDFTCIKTPERPIDWTNKPPVTVPGGSAGSNAKLREITAADLPVSCTASYTATTPQVPFANKYSVQINDVSLELSKVLKCMYDLLNEDQIGRTDSSDENKNLTANEIYITSISDSAGIENCVGAAWTDPGCAHSQNSCHYGGPSPATPPKSYAVDIRSNNRTADENALIGQLITKAGGRYYDETNVSGVEPHHHMSVAPCGSAY